MSILDGDMIIFSGTSNLELSEKIIVSFKSKKNTIGLSGCKFKRFPDGEILVELLRNARGGDVFVIQSTSYPVNWNLMELLIMIDTLKRASADRITAVIPYYGYARQDWKDRPRVPITARLVADMLTTAGADRVLTMDLHAEQIQGFFSIPVDNLTARPLFKVFFDEMFKKMIGNGNLIESMDDVVVVAPDVGRVKLAKKLATELRTGMAIVVKDRTTAYDITSLGFIGDVRGKVVVIFDDIISTGETIIKAANILRKKGKAKKIFVCCTHAVMARGAVEKIEKSEIDMLIITDTISQIERMSELFNYSEDIIVGDRKPDKGEKHLRDIKGSDRFRGCKKIKVLSVAKLFKEAIKSIHKNESVSALFYPDKIKNVVRDDVNLLIENIM
ncbi:MAG: ribose-phosphate diphosphokinase [bacterium]